MKPGEGIKVIGGLLVISTFIVCIWMVWFPGPIPMKVLITQIILLIMVYIQDQGGKK